MRLEPTTPRGPARVDLDRPTGAVPASLLVLGHGAGGDVDAVDLVAVRDAALRSGVGTALVTQPYRVAGRRAPAPATHLDEAWCAVLAGLIDGSLIDPGGPDSPAVWTVGIPVIVGGRSSGARVACRTARAVGAAGVVALAFPTHAPGRPDRSRAEELRTGLPTLVVNGDRDPFGVPPVTPGVDLLVRPGERHDLRGAPGTLAGLVVDWLRDHGWAR